MLLEVIDGFEFLLGAYPGDESDVEALPVKFAGKIEQEHFEQRRTVVEGRPPAEAGDAVNQPATDPGAHRIDAVLQAAGRVQPQIGCRKAELAAALVAVDHLAGDEPRHAKKLRRLDHLAVAERGTYRAGRYRAALVLERRNDIDRKAEPLAVSAQQV